VLLAEDNGMIEAVPSDRTDEPFRAPVLPWRLRRDQSVSYAHCPEPPYEGFALRDQSSSCNDLNSRETTTSAPMAAPIQCQRLGSKSPQERAQEARLNASHAC
jgi:hypothetical protein